ncbi:PREDICTED: proteolipid protein 2 [Thamnophis sirtalis]|uniref:Proteolipid protein 2 n=1 Tax=Thamnophis sirtalis TaxID=35019 RepID=A0A6I9YP58_9SAUR|nr:PREDICTED: proteolipid protein 2 [Thamnophis sirtalis]
MESSGSSKGCMEQFTSFIRSQRGMLLFVEIIACIVIIICYGASSSFGYTGLAVFILIYCVVLFIIFMLGLHLQLAFIHWGWTTFVRALIGAVAFLITAIIVFFSRPDGGAIAGAVASILTGILFAYDAYTILPTLRKSHTAAPSEPTEGI